MCRLSHPEGVGDEEGEVGLRGIVSLEIHTAGKQSETRIPYVWQLNHSPDVLGIIGDVQVWKPREVPPGVIIIGEPYGLCCPQGLE
jgi:hypothetical protein